MALIYCLCDINNYRSGVIGEKRRSLSRGDRSASRRFLLPPLSPYFPPLSLFPFFALCPSLPLSIHSFEAGFPGIQLTRVQRNLLNMTKDKLIVETFANNLHGQMVVLQFGQNRASRILDFTASVIGHLATICCHASVVSPLLRLFSILCSLPGRAHRRLDLSVLRDGGQPAEGLLGQQPHQAVGVHHKFLKKK